MHDASDNSAIGERLRIERMRLGLSQAQISERIGMTRVTYGRYENGQRDIGVTALLALKAQGVNLSFLLDLPQLGDPAVALNLSLSLGMLLASLRARLGGHPGSEENLYSLCKRGTETSATEIDDAVSRFLSLCSQPFEPERLMAIFDQLAAAAEAEGLTLSWEKAGQAVAMIYQRAPTKHYLDAVLIRDVALLAGRPKSHSTDAT